MPKKKLCSKAGCRAEAEILGLCEAHYRERREDERLEALATATLHGSYHTAKLADEGLKSELAKLQKYWRLACDAKNGGRQDTVLKDEAEYALSWCISLAKEIILADEALKEGKPVSTSLAYTKDWVWGRFTSLEAGLMSNGVARPKDR